MSRYPISGTCIFSSRIWIPSAHGVLLRQQFLFSERKKCIPGGTIRDYQQISMILSNSSGARRTVDFPTLVTFSKSRYLVSIILYRNHTIILYFSNCNMSVINHIILITNLIILIFYSVFSIIPFLSLPFPMKLPK